MKTMLKIYVWVSYIVGLPLVLLQSIVILVWTIIKNKHEFDEFDVKDTVLAYLSGMVDGHKWNMSRIDDICE